MHDKIANMQKDLISIGDAIYACRSDGRKKVALSRQFELAKKKLAAAIAHLYGMEELDSAVPVIKDVYAAD